MADQCSSPQESPELPNHDHPLQSQRGRLPHLPEDKVSSLGDAGALHGAEAFVSNNPSIGICTVSKLTSHPEFSILLCIGNSAPGCK